ncbi:MAG: FAD-binding oxidoreductase [Pseudomonadota bacterium]
MSNQKKYATKIKALTAISPAAFKQEKSIGLQKNTSNLFRNRRKANKLIDLRSFNHVLEVNPQEGYADIEGMTTYEAIVDECLKHHVMPTVVPELKTITIGGALSGIGIESSSFRYGLVHETILEFDLLLADGTVATCRPDNEHKDLFFALPNSYGTLGYVLRVKVKTIPVKPYVKLHYQHFNDPKLCLEALANCYARSQKEENPQFLESVSFQHDQLSIISAEFVDQAPYVSNYKFMKIFYRAIQKKREDYLTVNDYIWRWDTDWFWCSKKLGLQNKLLRLLAGKWLLNSSSYWKIMNFYRNNSLLRYMQKVLPPQETVVQDILIPIEKSLEFYNFLHNEIKVKPLWLCPTHAYDSKVKYDLFNLPTDTLFINFGIWGVIKTKQSDGFYNKKIEKEVSRLNGYKSLYSTVHYSEQEFWEIYNKPHYKALKEKYDPSNIFRDLYHKVSDRITLH